MVRTMVLELDELDYGVIQAEIAHRQARSRAMGFDRTAVPPGESNLAGAILAEVIRDLNEYRALWDAKDNPDEAD